MRPTIDEVRTVGDYATTYQWALSFSRFPVAVGGFSLAALDVRCVSTTLPTAIPAVVTTAIRGHNVHQPGPVTYNPIDLVFAETVDNMIVRFFAAWREACSASVTGAHRIKADVTAIIDLVRLDREHKPIWTYTLIGAFLSNYNHGSLVGDSGGGTLQPALTIVYDYFKEGPASSLT